MILIVSMAKPDDYDEKAAHTDIKRKFEKLTDTPALVQHYSEITPQRVADLPVGAIFISGSGCPWPDVEPRKLDGLYELVMNTDIPIHGACAGHQLLGFFFNLDFPEVDSLEDEFVRKLGPGEPVSVSDRYPGYFKEDGMYEIEILHDDPIFDGFDDSLVVKESHFCEVKTLPDGFIHLAHSENTEIQAMRHTDRVIYGTQFHPEAWSEEFDDGKRFMQNFFRIAAIID
ncbi:MAG: glutamine amidotransferase-related protein [Armatimonadota bacterium]